MTWIERSQSKNAYCAVHVHEKIDKINMWDYIDRKPVAWEGELSMVKVFYVLVQVFILFFAFFPQSFNYIIKIYIFHCMYTFP